MNSKRVVVIGAGLSGLAASYDLARAGHRVTVLEAAPDFGGLASSFRVEGVPVERFYHFICRMDRHLLDLIDELELSPKLRWNDARTAFYFNGGYHRFGTAADLARFSVVPWSQRFRFGLHVLRCQHMDNWRELDRIPARRWLIDWIGQEAYDVIWHPLLKVKFGEHHDRISAAWMWHRIWRVAVSRDNPLKPDRFGYLEHGSATLVDPLVDWLRGRPNVTLKTGVRVESPAIRDGAIRSVRAGGEEHPCDAVVSTVALPFLSRLLPEQSDPYFERVRRVEYLGVVCMLLSLKRPFGRQFWTNVNDPRVSFNGIIEQTALNQDLRARGLNLVYIPYYLGKDEARYRASDQELFDEYIPMLRLINPEFEPSSIKEWHVFRTPYTQPIFHTGFRELMPEHRTSIRGLYATDSTQFYPEDRTLSAAIHQGRTVARMIDTDPI